MDELEIKKRAVMLHDATNEAIDHIKRRKKDFKEGINWGDLSCREAAYVIPHYDDPYWTVAIEEAFHNCGKFCGEVSRLLTEAGWPDVEVRTEW